jgi:RNA polymerase sigma-70 factor (ECF subfamily)
MEKSEILPDTDLLLWNISMNNDECAFRTLFEYYYVPLCLYAKRYVENKAVREDIVQDVFFTIWEKRKQIKVNTSAKNYLMASIKHNSLDYLRRQGYQQEYQNKVIENTPVYSENIDELYNLKELQELLAKTLEKLPEEYRIAFIMSRMEEKSVSEIAEKLSVSIRTVERYRNRAMEILKRELKDYLPISVILSLIC